ncbi:epoxyqueuosine reductase QueH [Heliorestis acidaminivorans]|uniref:Epoxyqueuosine reductase QueH n=1 Tax=Heliorestis acidaminivorans TaxID=553427 RepID=A0A6I0END7_9FIRM|nr:epoxyqueuosine reductase QueH [Heliorestis acidaminivorans]KAB2951252.1 epoxyqueuosine reductase QueH [Heliorestis acidaminivorans]
MKLLLHSCCGPCTIYPLEELRQQGHDVTAYFYNPNIHPYKEFRRRLETLEGYTATNNLSLHKEEDYELEEFLQQVAPQPAQRCNHCYRVRLYKTAEKARALDMEGFTTTLLVSPYQNHEQLKAIGEEIGKALSIPFIYIDFRPGFRKAQQEARELELYRQSYCGCIYSEKDRYYKPKPKKEG